MHRVVDAGQAEDLDAGKRDSMRSISGVSAASMRRTRSPSVRSALAAVQRAHSGPSSRPFDHRVRHHREAGHEVHVADR
jgi:hypothetical protein